MWPCAVPTPPACDSEVQLESVSSSTKHRTPNTQRRTANSVRRKKRKLESTRSARPLLHIHNVGSRRFVYCADDCACNRELNHGACDPSKKNLTVNGWTANEIKCGP